MNAEIGSEAAQSPEKEYINGIFIAVKILRDSFFDVVADYVLK